MYFTVHGVSHFLLRRSALLFWWLTAPERRNSADKLTGRRTSSPGWSGSSETGGPPVAACHNSSAGPLTGLNQEEHTKWLGSPAWPSWSTADTPTPTMGTQGAGAPREQGGEKGSNEARAPPQEPPTLIWEAAQKVCDPIGARTWFLPHVSPKCPLASTLTMHQEVLLPVSLLDIIHPELLTMLLSAAPYPSVWKIDFDIWSAASPT